MPAAKPEGEALGDEEVMRGLHRVLLETRVVEGRMVCGNCGHEYRIKEGIANFLLPSHLGEWRSWVGRRDAGLMMLQCEREIFCWMGWVEDSTEGGDGGRRELARVAGTMVA